MRVLTQWVRVELSAFAGLLVSAAAMGAYLAFDSFVHPNALFQPPAAAGVGFLATLAFGALPVTLGATLYVALDRLVGMRAASAVALGALAGASLFIISREMGWAGVLCGALTAAITHLLYRRWAGASQAR